MTQSQSYYSQEILHFIDAESSYFKPITPAKFAIAGSYYADLAYVLDYESDRWLRDWFNDSYGENQYCEVSYDWEDWLMSRTQQSVSLNFLIKYLPQEEKSNNYPQERKSWSLDKDLDGNLDDDLNRAVAIATPEDIQHWTNQIIQAVNLTKQTSVSFIKLRQMLDLSPAEIYLGIVLSERFSLIGNSDDFYGGFWVRLD